MNSADLVCAMAFRFAILKALFMIHRNKFIHQLGCMPRDSFLTGIVPLFFLQYSIRSGDIYKRPQEEVE